MKQVKLSEKAQSFLKQEEKAYPLPELKATIFASSDEDFERKKHKLLNKQPFYVTGGTQAKAGLPPIPIKEF